MTLSKDTGFNFDNSYINLSDMFFKYQGKRSFEKPENVIFNSKLARELSLDEEVLKSKFGLDVLCGNEFDTGSMNIAQAYAGHQFGYFNMLGDGRATLLGEHITSENKRFDIQLKGSGRTEFSRGGDGLATLSAMLREYIISEAMYGLNIATTRSLAVLKTGEKVLREEEIDGAVLTRIASSHIRVGTFAYAQRFGDTENVKELADYTLKRHFDIESSSDKKDYLFLLKEVIKKQANLIASWQLVGFIHGVMNSDNMTISGETIDYGPCAFMDEYNPATVFSSIDREGRYAYANQPNMGGWNLARFAETLIPLLHEDREEAIKIAQNEIKEYSHLYKKVWMNGMRKKLGIFNEEIADEYLIDGILSIMQKYKVDYTNTFYYLTTGRFDELEIHHTDEFEVWYKLWKQRLGRQDKSMEEARKLMRETNPVIIPRNHRVEEALASAKEGKYLILQYLLDALENPFDYSKDLEFYREVKKEDKSYVTYCGT